MVRTMSGGFCLHYDCSNRNSFGYCKTTVCINKHYQQEQWGSLSTTNRSESVVIKPLTNADRIRAMSDEELAAVFDTCPPNKNFKDEKNGCYIDIYGSEDEKDCYRCWLDWLRKEAKDEHID